ncbi:unnamed protein product [Cutaneotrichosporon oleaginosum]
MPQVQPSRLPRSRSTQSLRPPAAGTTSSATSVTSTPALGHQRKPSLTRPPRAGLRHKPAPLPSHRPSGSGTSSISTRSVVPSLGRLRPAPRPPTSSSNSSLSTTKEPPALRPVRSLTTLRQTSTAVVEKGKTPAPLTAARTGPAPSIKPSAPARSRPRAATLVESPETPPRSQRGPEKLTPNRTGERGKRTTSEARPLVLAGAKRVTAPARGESVESLQPQPSPPPKTTTTRSLIRRPLSLADRVFGNSKISAKDTNKHAPPPSPSPSSARQLRARPTVSIPGDSVEELRTSLRRRISNASPPKSPPPKSASPTAAKFSSTGSKFSAPPSPAEKSTSFKLPFSKTRTPARSQRLESTPARPATARCALPDTPAISAYLREQSMRIGHIGEEDISLASSGSFHALTPPGHESTDVDFVSAIAAQTHSHPRTRAASHRLPRSPLSPTSPLSPRRARPLAAELRAEVSRLKNERVLLETRIASLEAEEGRLTGLAEAALRDRQRALESAEEAKVDREAAMWEVVVQVADEAIEEERALKHAITVARAIVMAL